MEFLPFYFCESVCALLTNEANLDLVCRANPDCYCWTAAIDLEIEKRPKFTLDVGCSKKRWDYRICYSRGTEVTFQQFKESCENRHFCLQRISFGIFGGRIRSTCEEINEIIQYTASLIYKTTLDIGNTPQQFFDGIVAIYRGRSFEKICILKEDPSAKVLDFLQFQFNFTHLKELQLPQNLSENFRSKIEEFTLNGTFHSMTFQNTALRFDFFERIFNKQLVDVKKSTIFAIIACFWTNFGSFEKEIQVSYDGRQIVWRRADGVTVTIQNMKCFSPYYEITFVLE